MNITLFSKNTIAADSPDHVMPWGTKRDNSRNHRFNTKLYRLFEDKREPLHVLDLGCSGGGFVRDCVNDGCLAVGLEGSDYSFKLKRAEWATIPQLLFTCDVTKPFQLTMDGASLSFDVVTAWEVLEHIRNEDLPMLCDNVKRHLRTNGFWITSVAPTDDVVNGMNLHQTVKPMSWWISRMQELGLQHNPAYVRYFNTQFVRGPKFGAPDSFHLILSTQPLPAPPPLTTNMRMLDAWNGSGPQRLLKRLVLGD
jgi:SAM-dependent methyltransferase